MTITSLEPTSRCAILPSGDTLDLVKPGMSSVVGRNRGVAAADLDTDERCSLLWRGRVNILSRAARVRGQRGVAQGMTDAIFCNSQAICIWRGERKRRRLHLAILRGAVLELLDALGRCR